MGGSILGQQVTGSSESRALPACGSGSSGPCYRITRNNEMTSRFFPSVSEKTEAFEAKVRKFASRLSPRHRIYMYQALCWLHPEFVRTRFSVAEPFVYVWQKNSTIVFPSPLPLVKHQHIAFGYERWLEHKYCLPGFVEVEENDVVIDCGAYVGGFSLSAARRAHSVHIFEPDPANCECIRRNLQNLANVSVSQKGLHNTDSRLKLNVSASSVEHSFLAPDDGPPIRQEEVEVCTLAAYCAAEGFRRLDFVKLEAEGVEIEVFEGLGELKPRKFAIDVSPERNGESPGPELTVRLEELGYNTHQRGHVLFAHI